MITVRVRALKSGSQRAGDIGDSLGAVTIEANKDINLAVARVTGGRYIPQPQFEPAMAPTEQFNFIFTLSGRYVRTRTWPL